MFIRTLIVFLFVAGMAFGQIDCKIENEWKKDKALKRVVYTELAVIGFALTDVVLYPIAERSSMTDSYRMFQGALQLAISYILQKSFGWSSTVSFNAQLLTGVNDAIYYLCKPSEFKGSFNHLNYTPFYWINGGRLSKTDFKAQAGLGFSFGINLLF